MKLGGVYYELSCNFTQTAGQTKLMPIKHRVAEPATLTLFTFIAGALRYFDYGGQNLCAQRVGYCAWAIRLR